MVSFLYPWWGGVGVGKEQIEIVKVFRQDTVSAWLHPPGSLFSVLTPLPRLGCAYFQLLVSLTLLAAVALRLLELLCLQVHKPSARTSERPPSPPGAHTQCLSAV